MQSSGLTWKFGQTLTQIITGITKQKAYHDRPQLLHLTPITVNAEYMLYSLQSNAIMLRK